MFRLAPNRNTRTSSGIVRRSLLVVLYSAAPLAHGTDKPEALRRAEEARSAVSLHTLRVDYSRMAHEPDGSVPHTRLFTARAAGDSLVLHDYGDEDGVFVRGPDGQSAPITYNGPAHFLLQDDSIWRHVDRATYGDVFRSDDASRFNMFDPRRLGLSPADDYVDFDARAKALGYEVSYSERVEGDHHVVTARFEGGAVTWWIDPQRDWGVTKTESFVGERKIGETRYELADCDGIWFPVRVETYRLGAGDTEPSSILKVQRAEFNRSEHPLDFSPNNIGLESGMSVGFQDGTGRQEMKWTGDRLVPVDEYVELLRRGDVTLGDTYAREIARSEAADDRRLRLVAAAARQVVGVTSRPASSPAAVLTDWEKYTLRFCDAYRLDDEQRQRALTHLRECQRRAGRLLARHGDELAAIERGLAELRSAGDLAKSGARRAELDKALARVLAPLEAIFTEQLKPLLFKLPTRAQIDDAMKGDRVSADLAIDRRASSAARLPESQPHPP